MQSYAEQQSVDTGFDALDYGYAASPPQHRHTAIHGERDLWCAVIAQAFADLGVGEGVTPDKELTQDRRKCYEDAALWLLRDMAMFPFICDLAGVNPYLIRRAAQVFYGRTRMTLGALHSNES